MNTMQDLQKVMDRAIAWLDETMDLDISMDDLYERHGNPLSIYHQRNLLKTYVEALAEAHAIIIELTNIGPTGTPVEIDGIGGEP